MLDVDVAVVALGGVRNVEWLDDSGLAFVAGDVARIPIRQAQLALGELVRRLDNPRLAVDPPEYRPSPVLRGSRHLSPCHLLLRDGRDRGPMDP